MFAVGPSCTNCNIAIPYTVVKTIEVATQEDWHYEICPNCGTRFKVQIKIDFNSIEIKELNSDKNVPNGPKISH